jgi:phage-related protein
MNFQILFFATSVQALIEKWPVGTYVSFVCMKGKRIVILHGFVKKTQAKPIKELRLAKQRMKEVMND